MLMDKPFKHFGPAMSNPRPSQRFCAAHFRF